MKRVFLLITFSIGWDAHASILSPWNYIKQYQLGIDVGTTSDTATFNFDIDPATYSDTENCKASERNAGLNTCNLTFAKPQSSNYGVFLEQPFKRKGFWHIDWDISFAFRSFSGEFSYGEDETEEARVDPDSLPIKDVVLNYYGITSRLYLTFGITPKTWPEILISVGPTGEVFGGNASFNGKDYKEKVTIRRSQVLGFSYVSLDIVFWRFGKGYFGFTMWNHQGKDDVEEGNLLPPDEAPFSDLGVTMSRNFFGLKLLLK